MMPFECRITAVSVPWPWSGLNGHSDRTKTSASLLALIPVTLWPWSLTYLVNAAASLFMPPRVMGVGGITGFASGLDSGLTSGFTSGNIIVDPFHKYKIVDVPSRYSARQNPCDSKSRRVE